MTGSAGCHGWQWMVVVERKPLFGVDHATMGISKVWRDTSNGLIVQPQECTFIYSCHVSQV